jgi:olfactory receptor
MGILLPHKLAHLVSAQKLISFHSYVFQLCVSLAVGVSSFFFLRAMFYDKKMRN